MMNPFESIETRLGNIETLLLDIKHGNPLSKEIPPIFGVETCEKVTGLAKPTLYRNTSKNLMPHYRRDGKIFFKRDEIYAWMTENRVKTQSESVKEMDEKFITKNNTRR